MSNTKMTFSKAMDNHPALKGGQSRLPDALQAKIIGSKLKKTAARDDERPRGQRRVSIAMNQRPVRRAVARSIIGAGLGAGLGKVRGFKTGKHALVGAVTLPAVGELERRARNMYYGLDGSEKLSSFVKSASDLEGRMARRQLTEICEMAQELLMYMGDEEDLHEWVQNKLTTIHDRLSSVHSYVSYEKKNPPVMQPQLLGSQSV